MLEAIKVATSVYQEHGNDVHEILQKYGITVLEDPLAGNLSELYFGSHVVLSNKLNGVRRRSLLAHVIGHIFLHQQKGARNLFMDSMNRGSILNINERNAQVFAAYLLIPVDKFKEIQGLDPRNKEHVRRLARKFNVTSELALFRLQVEQFISQLPVSTKATNRGRSDPPVSKIKRKKVWIVRPEGSDCASRYKQQVRIFLDSLAEPAYLADTDGSITWVNIAFIRMLDTESRDQALLELERNLAYETRLELIAHHRMIVHGDDHSISIVMKNGRSFELSTRSLLENGQSGDVCCLFTIMKDITAIKAVREGSEEKAMIIDAVSKASPAAIFIYDILESKVLWVSDQVKNITGYSAREFVNLPSYGFISLLGIDLETVSSDDNALPLGALTIKDGHHKPISVTRKDGKRAWVSISTTIFQHTSDGLPELMLGVGEDITEQMKKDLALVASEERFRRLAMAPHLGVVISEDGILVDCNDEALKMFGYSRREAEHLMNNAPLWKFVAPKEGPVVKKAIREDREEAYRTTAVRKDRTRFPIEVCGRSVKLEDRLIRITSFIDITEQVALENALKSSEWRYRSMVEHAPACIARTNLRGDILYANEALIRCMEFEDLEHFRSEGALSRYADQKVRQKLLARLTKYGGYENEEVVFVTRTGKLRCLLSSSQIDGNEITSVAIDITDLKNAEMRLREKDRKYRHLLETTSAGIVHTEVSGKVHYANKKMIEMLGHRTQKDLIKLRFSELFHDPAQRSDLFTRLYQGRSIKNLQTALTRKDGSSLKCLISGNLHGSVAELTVTDISDLVQLQSKVGTSAKIMRELLDNPLFGIAQTDRDGKVIFANTKCLELLGFDRFRELRKDGSLLSRFSDQDQEFLMQSFNGPGRLRNLQADIRKADGKNCKVVVSGCVDDDKISWIIMETYAETVILSKELKKKEHTDA